MKSNFHGKNLAGFIGFFFILAACGSNPPVSGTNETIGDSGGILSLDAAIREAGTRIDGRIEEGTKIALLNFNSPSNQFSEYVLDELSANLVDSGKLVVVDRKEIDLIHSEYDFQTSGEVSDSSMQEIGQILGAQSIVSGSLIDIGGEYRLMVRVLNVQSAAVEVQYRTDIANDNRVKALLSRPDAANRPSAGLAGNNTVNSPQAQSNNNVQGTPNSSGSAISGQPNIESAGSASVPEVTQRGSGASVSYERFTELRKLDFMFPRNSGEIVFTPDSKAIVAYDRPGNQGYIKLWDVETGKAIRTIREAGAFSHIAISPDGRRFVTAASSGEGNRILLWDLATGAYRESRGHTSSVRSLAFSPDGNYFISGSSDKTIKIWSADTGQEVRTLTGHTGNVGSVLSVSYSPDGRQIVSCSDDRTIKIWDVANGSVIRTISANCSKVSYCPDGRKIAAVEGNKIHIFDGQTGRELFTLTGHTGIIRAISFSPDGIRLLSIDQGSGGNIIVWNMSNGWEVGRLNMWGNGNTPFLVVSADGKYFATGRDGSGISIWGE
jgi:WD40 repeat protein